LSQKESRRVKGKQTKSRKAKSRDVITGDLNVPEVKAGPKRVKGS
jgi:hypothetical protein